jgi:flagellar assembly protein FliH
MAGSRSQNLRPVPFAEVSAPTPLLKSSRSTAPQTHPNRATGPVPLSRATDARPVPLAERLPHAASPTSPVLPNWVASRAPLKARPLRAGTESLEVVPVARSSEEEFQSERQRELEEARSEAELEGLRIGQAKVEMLIERYLDAIKRLGKMTRKAKKPNVDEVVDMALFLAHEIVGRELTLDRDILVRRLNEVLATVTVDASTVVRLGNADLAYIRRRRPELAAAGVQFVEDASLGPGGCRVETPKAQIDLCTQARLAAVRGEVAAIVAESGASQEEAEDKSADDDDIVVADDAEDLEIE